MRAHEGYRFSNIAATPADFVLEGGFYEFAATATFGGGSVKLQQPDPAGTFGDVGTTTSFGPTAGKAQVYLPPGTYRLLITTATAVYATVTRIPLE
jgi:hypothetical protein